MGTPHLLRPTLLVLAEDVASQTVRDLFGHRGFTVVTLDGAHALASYLGRADVAPAAAFIDLRRADAARARRTLRAQSPATVLVGVAADADVATVQDEVDAIFAPPVDRARLFVRVVELIAERNKGHRATKITGVCGVIRGNPLFHRALDHLHGIVPPVNAGAVLEATLRELGATPDDVDAADLLAVVASGRLFEALTDFADEDAVLEKLAALATMLDSPSGPRDPCIPMRIEDETTARTCG